MSFWWFILVRDTLKQISSWVFTVFYFSAIPITENEVNQKLGRENLRNVIFQFLSNNNYYKLLKLGNFIKYDQVYRHNDVF